MRDSRTDMQSDVYVIHMQSQTKTYNRGRNIVWGMWQRKPPMVIAGCSSWVAASCLLFPTDAVSLVPLCLLWSSVALLLCCVVANCSAPFLLCLYPPMLLQYAAMQLYFRRRRRNCLHCCRPHCHLYRRCRHRVLHRRFARSFIFLVS